jgi:type IV pilus assembly protein PilC
MAASEEKTKGQPESSGGWLVYPAVVLTLAGGILVFVMVFIVPKFADMFKELDIGELPGATKALFFVSKTFTRFWPLVVVLLVLLGLALRAAARTPQGRLLVEKAKRGGPIPKLILTLAVGLVVGCVIVFIVMALYLPLIGGAEGP